MSKTLAALLLAASLTSAAFVATTPARADGFSLNIDAPADSKAGKKLAKANQVIGLVSGLSGSSAKVVQRGKRNKAGINQKGKGSKAAVGQFGSDHVAQVDQSGGNNSAGVLQFGKGSKCKVSQTGDQSSLCIGAGW